MLSPPESLAEGTELWHQFAIVGVGNCAASLVQGVHYYRNAAVEDRVPGLMHVKFGDYHVGDIRFVAAFDVDFRR